MIRIRDIKVPVGAPNGTIIEEIAKIMCLDKIYPGNSYPDFSYEIIRRSTDARRKPHIFYVYTVRLLIGEGDEDRILGFFRKNARLSGVRRALEKIIAEPLAEYEIAPCGDTPLYKRPVIVGFGPAGMFAALALCRRGFSPVIIERGEKIDERRDTVDKFWKGGALRPDSNVLFGEGGAGTFSDGKLNTLTKDKDGRNTFILKTFYEHGSPKDVTIDAKPHVGTDILQKVVANIREEIISCGGRVLCSTKLTDIETSGDGPSEYLKAVKVEGPDGAPFRIETDVCILCPGHSARDTFEMLYDRGVRMSQKSFAAGFRIIHPQSLVNRWQYGVDDPSVLGLPPADYKVTNTASNGRRVYSFCMCPGGYVVNSSSEEGAVCVNGMSYSQRDGRYANAAIVAAVGPDDFVQDKVDADHPLSGMYYQRRLEQEAFRRGGGMIPVCDLGAFARDAEPSDGRSATEDIDKAVMGQTSYADLSGIYCADIDEAIIESIRKFGYTMKGFDEQGILCGVETRTSSPVRIERDDELVSNVKGLYPCGEGAGYAGGIMSAAADGLRVADRIIRKYHLETEQ